MSHEVTSPVAATWSVTAVAVLPHNCANDIKMVRRKVNTAANRRQSAVGSDDRTMAAASENQLPKAELAAGMERPEAHTRALTFCGQNSDNEINWRMAPNDEEAQQPDGRKGRFSKVSQPIVAEESFYVSDESAKAESESGARHCIQNRFFVAKGQSNEMGLSVFWVNAT